MANRYDVGDLVECSSAFVDKQGAPHDPTTVIFSVKTPAGAITSYTYGQAIQVVKETTGVYHVDVSVTAPGTWWYRFAGTGNGQAASENFFEVEESEFV